MNVLLFIRFSLFLLLEILYGRQRQRLELVYPRSSAAAVSATKFGVSSESSKELALQLVTSDTL